jgi:hypothetical protein
MGTSCVRLYQRYRRGPGHDLTQPVEEDILSGLLGQRVKTKQPELFRNVGEIQPNLDPLTPAKCRPFAMRPFW